MARKASKKIATPKRRKLLNIDANPKTVKGQAFGFMTAVLYLSPASTSGVNLCAMAKIARCDVGCLNTGGQGGIAKGGQTISTPDGELPSNDVQRARLWRSAEFNENRAVFLAQLCEEIAKFIAKAERKGLKPALRLNGTSDIRWEDEPVTWNGVAYPHIFAAFPALQCYDYTKIPNRRRAVGIPNYHLSFSFSSAVAFLPYVARVMNTQPETNIVTVFRVKKGAPLPSRFLGREVIDGDESDLRFLDARGVVVGLRAKGRAKKDTSGFVVDIDRPMLQPTRSVARRVARQTEQQVPAFA
jgi:hypothetical protein